MNLFLDFYAAPPELMRHAAVLIVAGPLIAACAAMLSPNSRWAWVLSVLATAFTGWMALCLAGEVARRGVVEYAIGGFAPPAGIAFRVDALGVFFVLLIATVGFLTAIFSGHSLAAEVRPAKRTMLQSGFLLCLAGMLGLVVTGDAFNAFVFLEIASIGTYALVGVGARGDRKALPAAFNYLIMGTVGATFYVIGVGFLYGATGTLNMADIAARLPTLAENRAVQAGFAMIVVGLGVKAAVFPLHGWLPGAYGHAPSLIAVFLSATATKAALYLLARFVFGVFGQDDAFVGMFLTWVLAPMGAAAAIACSIQAIFQTEMRRILAYSSVAQVGYIAMALALGTQGGVSAALLHAMMHALMKAALFMALGGIAISLAGRRLTDFAGAGRAAPWTMTAFAISSLSLIGAPLTGGFLSKWKLVEASISAGWGWAAIIIVASSLLAVFYAGRMVETIFFKPPAAGMDAVRDPSIGVLVPLWALTLMTLWFGVDASAPMRLAEAGARAVLGTAP